MWKNQRLKTIVHGENKVFVFLKGPRRKFSIQRRSSGVFEIWNTLDVDNGPLVPLSAANAKGSVYFSGTPDRHTLRGPLL